MNKIDFATFKEICLFFQRLLSDRASKFFYLQSNSSIYIRRYSTLNSIFQSIQNPFQKTSPQQPQTTELFFRIYW